MDKARVGYSEFVKLCHIEDAENWCSWLSVQTDGVYVKEPEHFKNWPPEEKAEMTKHPLRDLKKPILSFPCSLNDMGKALEEVDMYGYIDPFHMAEWLLAELAKEKHEMPSECKICAPSEPKNSHLLLIAAMLDLLTEEGRRSRNQSAVKSDILTHFKDWRGLSARNLDKLFGEAAKAKKAAKETE